MKGKYANSAVHRRAENAQAELEQARADLAEERVRRHAETEALKTELRKVRAEILNEARRLASDELEKRLREAEEERRMQGISDDMITHWQYRLDRLVMNACRYFSMTEGTNPLQALAQVWTWVTDEDSYGAWQDRVKLAALGLPRDGWVVWALQRQSFLVRARRESRRRLDTPLAISLERAEREDHPEIHPDYKKWASYYDVDYRASLGLIDDDGSVKEVIR